MDYYEQKHMIARVDQDNNIIGMVEKWEAHTKGILHRAFTVALKFEKQYVLQHRKHPAFDGVFDLTTSSHQIYKGDQIQDSVEAIHQALEREWNLKEKDVLYKPTYEGIVYYQAKDPHGKYQEHEFCEIWTTELKKLPTPNFDYAYGYSLIERDKLYDENSPVQKLLAPWVLKTLEEKLI